MFYEHSKTVLFKVLVYFIYFIIEKYVYLNYLCKQQ